MFHLYCIKVFFVTGSDDNSVLTFTEVNSVESGH